MFTLALIAYQTGYFVMPRHKPKKTQEIKQKREQWINSWKDNKDIYDTFTQFVWGNQWLDDEARVFETYKKIPLTSNKCAPILNHLVGEQRQNTPSIQCVPEDDVPVEVVEVREALVKDILFNSDAKQVFQTAFQCAAAGGYGVFYLDTEYAGDHSFDQVIVIRRGMIPTRFFWDMSSVTPCKTDGMFAGFDTLMSRPKFRSIYGKTLEEKMPPSSLEEGGLFNDDESITITTYFERKYDTTTIYQLSNDRVVDADEFKMLERVEADGVEVLVDGNELVTVVKDRLVPRYRVKKGVYAGEYELDSEWFPSEQLPIIFVDQNSFINKDGNQVIRSFVKDAYDSQRYLNYLMTQSAYLMKISRYDQFLVSKENVRSPDTVAAWKDPLNIKGGIFFDESRSGFIPQQLRPPELSASLVQQYQQFEKDILSSTGMYQAYMGEQGNETSGAAVDARTRQGSYSTYTPFDNINRAIVCAGQIINEMIPKVYDTERTLTVTMKDTGPTPVTINRREDAYGTLNNDMTKGRYTIRLLPGPSWEGQKQEALSSMQMVLQGNPELFGLIADLFVENLPLANNIELRNRLKTIVPPDVIEAGKTGKPLPPKQEQQNPELVIKMKELAIKEEELKLQQQKLMMEGKDSEIDAQMKWQEIEMRRQENAKDLQETILRFTAENNKTQSAQQIAHANNIVKLLTSKHPEPTMTSERE